MSRGKTLILAGSCAVLLGALLLAWVNDSARPLYVAEVAAFLLLVPGIVTLLGGCIVFCVKGEARQVLVAGAIVAGVSLIVIPGISSLVHFEANVHGWTGVLFFLWLPSCTIGPMFLLIGVGKLVLRKR